MDIYDGNFTRSRDRAAQAVAKMRAERAMRDIQGRVNFPLLEVFTKDGEVYSFRLWSKRLGSLAGAVAGIMDAKYTSLMMAAGSALTGYVPRAGTLFIAFADGSKPWEARMTRGSNRHLRKIDDEIRRFNAMALAAEAVDAAAPGSSAEPSDDGTAYDWNQWGETARRLLSELV